VSAPLLATFRLGVLALGLGCLATLPDHPPALDVIWRGVICGLGFGFFQAPNNREILGSAPRSRSGSASGVLATVRVTGQSIGAALVAIAIGTSAAAREGGQSAALAGPAHLSLWVSAATAGLACLVSALRLRRSFAGPARPVSRTTT
jgi:DHA2 family multidrug resistance protein-like MFS transporter